MKFYRVLVCWLLLATQALASITHQDDTGQTLYVLFQTSATTFDSFALTESPTTIYQISDAALVSGGFTATRGEYPFWIHSGSPSDTPPSATPLGTGTMVWNGTAEPPVRQAVPTFSDQAVVVAQNPSSTPNGISTSVTVNDTGCDSAFLVINDVTGSTITIVDSTGSVWTNIDQDSQGGFIRSSIYKCVKPITSATHTITVSTIAPSLFYVGTKGLKLTSPDDQASAATGSSTSAAPGSITPSVDNALVIATCAASGTGSITAPAGFTQTGTPIGYNSLGGGGNIGGGMAYQIQTTATARNPTWTVPNGGWVARALSFKPQVAGASIALTSFPDGKVFQREIDPVAHGQRTYKTIAFSGTYVDEPPASVDVRVYSHGTSTVVQDWRPLENFTASSGTWSGSLAVDQGGWYAFAARDVDVGGNVLATSPTTVGKSGVGIVIAMLGQSNEVRMFDVYDAPTATDDLTRQFVSGRWAAVTGDGAIAYANAVQDGTGIPVGLLNYGVAGSGLVYNAGSGKWDSETAGQPLPLFLLGLTAAGGDCEQVLWDQGEADTINPSFSAATYKTALTTLYGRILTATNRTAATCKFGVSLMGPLDDPDSNSTAADCTNLRQGQLEWTEETTGGFCAASTLDSTMDDFAHREGVSYATTGRRWAQSTLYELGEVEWGAKGPKLFNAWRRAGSETIYLGVTGLRGSSLEELDGTTDGGSLAGFEVSDDNFATTLTIDSTAFSGNTIELTLADAPADDDDLEIRYLHGKLVDADTLPDATINSVFGSYNPQGDSRGLPLLPRTEFAVELRSAFSASDLVATARLPVTVGGLDIGWTLKTLDGTVVLERSSEGIAITDETTIDAGYSTFVARPADFTAGYVVWDNGVTSVQELVPGGGLTTGTSPFLVDDDHTWGFTKPDQTTSPDVLTETKSSSILLSMSFAEPLPAGASIETLTAVTVADVALHTEPTITSSAIDIGKRKINIIVNAASATVGDYTFAFEVQTPDGQTYKRYGVLTIE